MSNKRKAQDTEGRGRKKSKRPEPVVAHWPASPVDTFGWVTDIPHYRKIYKYLAQAQYRLTDKHMKDLRFENRPHIKGGDAYVHLYMEREVEWVAWQVHGGPDGLWHMLRRLRQEHVQSSSAEPFPCPSGYTPGRRYDLDRTSPPSCDRYLMDNPSMVSAKAELPSWFWIECNIALNRALSNGRLPLGDSTSATTERVYGIRAAQRYFHRHSARYAGRPPDPVSTGRSIWLPMLRASLSNAPTISANLRDTDAWGPDKDRLRFHAGNYEWGDEYLRGIFRQLCSLIRDLGVDDAGLKSVRWEVYHRYARSVDGGLRYDARGRFWTDSAGVWLDGRIEHQRALDSMRGRVVEGLEYNALLPVLDTAHSAPSPAPVPFISGSPSPPRIPIAGPSSV